MSADLAPALSVATSEEPLPQDDRLAIHIGLRAGVRKFEPPGDLRCSGRRSTCAGRVGIPTFPPHVDGVANLLPSKSLRSGAALVVSARRATGTGRLVPGRSGCLAGTWREAVSRSFVAGAALKPETIRPASALDAIPKNLLRGLNTSHRPGMGFSPPLDQGHLAVRGLVNALIERAGLGAIRIVPD